MARANAFPLLFLVLVAVTAIVAAHPFRNLPLKWTLLQRQTSREIHSFSDTSDVPRAKGRLRSRYGSTFALPITSLEQLRSESLSPVGAGIEANESSIYAVILPLAVDQLQQKLEAFMRSLSNDLAALFGFIPSSSLDAHASLSDPTSATSLIVGTTLSLGGSSAVISANSPSSFSTTQATTPSTLSTTFLSALSVVTQTLTVQHSIITTSTQSSSSPTTVSLKPSKPSIFDPGASDNVVVYYGQTIQTSAVPITEVCADSTVDVVILAFVPILFGPGGWPTLNIGPHCWAANTAQTEAGATGLVDCVSDGFAKQVQQCQDAGKKIMISLGGAKWYSDTAIPSDGEAEILASKLWNLFLGGTENLQTNAMRPFGDVILDGIDIDNESGTTAHIAPLISALRTLFRSSAATKPYFLSAAPQCPRPDASIPLSSMQTSVDFVWVQFYNNPSCNLASGTPFLDSLSAWSSDLAANASGFVDTGNGVSSPRLYMGVPAWPGAGSGYVDANAFRSLLQVMNGAHANFGGVMFWDGAFGEQSAGTDGSSETFMQIVKDVLG